MPRSVKFVYFAWVRDRIGVDEEVIDLPDRIATGEDVIAFLKARGEGYQAGLADGHAIRMAADRQHVGLQDPVGQASEIALFPPMTGG